MKNEEIRLTNGEKRTLIVERSMEDGGIYYVPPKKNGDSMGSAYDDRIEAIERMENKGKRTAVIQQEIIGDSDNDSCSDNGLDTWGGVLFQQQENKEVNCD